MPLSGLMALLRALGVPGLDALKKAGFEALKRALRAALVAQGERVQKKALARLKKDGVDAKLTQDGPFTDRDGVQMNGRQWFVHEALFAIPRTIMGGTAADLAVRDDHFASWGLAEADTLLAGVTDPAQALTKVFDRLIEQFS
jgi:hypothetical protein